MRVALTGVSGFLGAAIARRLAESGHAVTGLVRASSRRDHLGETVDRFVVGDQADPAAWEPLLDGADAVIHNALDWDAVKRASAGGPIEPHLQANVAGPIGLLHASAPRPFVFMSTIAVHHEMLPRWDGRIEEDHPTRPGSLYGAAKAAVEAHLFAAAADDRHVASIRPCAVYGMDPRAERTIGWPIVAKLATGEPYARAGGGKFVHVDDVAAATVGALESPAAAGGVFNLVDTYARWADWAAIIADELGIDATIDDSSPANPKNEFLPDAARSIGAGLDRGTDGIREHVREMIARMREMGALA
ncbi:MAG: NAD-dependent epimerase/dehydratase family protein [Phycisphaerales bacterium]